MNSDVKVISLLIAIIVVSFCAAIQLLTPFEDDWSVIFDFIGSFHPLILHMPIGLWFGVFALFLFAAISPDSIPRSIVYGLTVLTFITAVLTFTAGFILYLGGGYGRDAIALHMYSSLAFLAFLGIFLVLYRKGGRPIYEWASALVTTAILLIAGHAGGVITHGNPLDRAPWKIFAERAAQKDQTVTALGEACVFHELVVPILEDKCMACHGAERAKGKLKMNSYAALLKGGSKGACFIPGDLDSSLMIQRINLPLEDIKRMPPKDKAQLTAQEAAFLEWWVLAALPEAQLIDTITFPKEQQIYVQSIIGKDPKATQAREAKAQTKRLLKIYAEFQKDFPGVLVQSILGEPHFELSSVSMLGYDEVTVRAALEPLAGNLIRIDWNRRSLDVAWNDLFCKADGVEVLNLTDTVFAKADFLKLFASMSQLKKVNLTGTQLSDTQILSLPFNIDIETMVLTDTNLTENGYRKLMSNLPNTEIICNYSL
jgi:hypothetical protein